MRERQKNKKIKLGQFYTSSEVTNFMVSLSSKPKNTKVLESGFGEGVFIESLLNNGYSNIKGYDIDHNNCSYVKEKYGSRVDAECLNYLDSPIDEKFDLIIGNPPYVSWNNIPDSTKEFLKKDPFWSKYSNGEWDLLYAFIIWSIEKLNDGGELIYIVPYNWFNSTYASSLRKYLIEKGYFDIICHFGEYKLFKDCYPNNIIFKYTKSSSNKNKPIHVSDFKGKNGDVAAMLSFIKNEFDNINPRFKEKETEDFKIFTIDQFNSENLWYLASPSEKEYIKRIEESANGVKLSDYLNIGVGIVSGLDDAFLVSTSELKEMTTQDKKLVRHFVKAKNCERFYVNKSANYIFADGINSESDLCKYPEIYKKLLRYKDGLTGRYISKNKKWWHWATVRNIKLFENSSNGPKIFVPCMDRSLKPRYSYATQYLYGSGDVLIITNKQNLKEDLIYVLAWLNSDIINNWYRLKGSRTGYRIRYTQSYVSQIPLRLIDWANNSEVEIYNQIVDKTKLLTEKKSNHKIEKEINELILKLI